MPDHDLVYHIVPREDWLAAEAAGAYRPASVDSQGFIHCSTLDQVVETANRFYRGEGGLVVLCIDASRLRVPLRYEPPDMAGESVATGPGLFPHLYGPLSPEAVRRVVRFEPNADGSFALPPELRED